MSEFVKEVAKYFMEFLETDFHKRRIPKRNTNNMTKKGDRVGINLEKYPALKEKLRELFNNGLVAHNRDYFTLKKGQFTTDNSNELQDIERTISRFIDQNWEDIINKTQALFEAAEHCEQGNRDEFLEKSENMIREVLKKDFIDPFLEDLNEPLESLNLADEDNKSQFESEISDLLFSTFKDGGTEIFQTFFEEQTGFDWSGALHDAFPLPEIKGKLLDLSNKILVIPDAFQTFYEIHKNMGDKEEIYLYFYEITHEGDKFPIFYAPITVEESHDEFKLKFDRRIFINIKAINFVAEKIKKPPCQLERIIYLNNGENFEQTVQETIGEIGNIFGLRDSIDVKNSNLEKTQREATSLSNKSYLFLFDKSDEALINDYEEILKGDDNLLKDFESLLNTFIDGGHPSIRTEVEQEWRNKNTPQKLIIESPVPLNEEQKQVLIALKNQACKLLIIEGPPGTGKSHTITAIACKSLLEGKSVLILSDQKVALDVVETKIGQTLAKVRHGDGSPTPILRIGKRKIGNTFSKIMSEGNLNSIRDRLYNYESICGKISSNKKRLQENIETNLEKNIDFFADVDKGDIAFYAKHIEFENELPENDQSALQKIEDYLGNENYEINDLEELRKIFSITEDTRKILSDNCQIDELNKFSSKKATPAETAEKLKNYIDNIESLKIPFIGYWFQKKKILKYTQQLKQHYPAFEIENPEENLELLNDIHKIWSFMLDRVENDKDFLKVKENLSRDKFDQLKGINKTASNILNNQNLTQYIKWRNIKRKLNDKFEEQPEDDFFEKTHDLESWIIFEMASFIDKQIDVYAEEYNHEIDRLRGIINAEKKFPTGLFKNLQTAFPCILSGIRDYAEFMPLEKDLFDLIIIDEASQVSVAHALTALIRGKQIIVLGDDKQFSNIKSAQADKSINKRYKSNVQDAYRREMPQGAEDRGQLEAVEQHFDIKNSILKFSRSIRNYVCGLKKHLRCYPEIISYSDKYFYNNRLQCIKIRGKSIDEVIKFEFINHDGKIDAEKNVNELEANFIIAELKKFKETGDTKSIGIITPLKEQALMLEDKINALSEEREWLKNECQLKIMTFDTCQGEERDYIFYSMVATMEKDRLSYIFPAKNFENIEDVKQDKKKYERLNVGFSRAKECIHFVLSKPIEEFSGAIKDALNHYQKERKHGRQNQYGGTDVNSPMEPKIQEYFHMTKFHKDNKERITFIPQFKIGQYLKQLDSSYNHPNYIVDFLLLFDDQKIVIEYDGFQHFPLDAEGPYMTEEDIYRQKVLEGYGYRFLRINRFNIGQDPIETLNKRLEALVKKNTTPRWH